MGHGTWEHTTTVRLQVYNYNNTTMSGATGDRNQGTGSLRAVQRIIEANEEESLFSLSRLSLSLARSGPSLRMRPGPGPPATIGLAGQLGAALCLVGSPANSNKEKRRYKLNGIETILTIQPGRTPSRLTTQTCGGDQKSNHPVSPPF